MGHASAVGRLLVRCVTEHDWSLPLPDAVEAASHLDLAVVAAAARFHGVSGCVYRSVLPLTGRPGAAGLVAGYHEGVDRHLRALGDLAVVGPSLDAAGLDWLVLKGPVLAEVVYPRADLRSYNDLDVLVPGRDLHAAVSAVEAAGGRVLERNWPLLKELGVGELLVRLRHGTLLDLHWQVINERRTRRRFDVPLADLHRRARPVRLGAVEARTPDATDTLLHLCLHASLSGGNRLVWLKDVERAVAAEPPAWEEVLDRARRWGVGPPVAIALARSAAVLGAAVPPDVPPALAGGRAWLRLASLADRLSPPERAHGDRSPSRIVSRASSRDAASSATELARRLLAAASDGRRLSRAPAGPDTDATSPRSTRHARGSEADRRAFLDAAAEEGP
ncbi:MAG: nucleotidyltransferase family protein [Acidimicrobiia bacterium]